MPYPDAWYPPPALRLSPDEAMALCYVLGDATHQLDTRIRRAEIGVREMDDIELGRQQLVCLRSVLGKLREMEVPDDWMDQGSPDQGHASGAGVCPTAGEELSG